MTRKSKRGRVCIIAVLIVLVASVVGSFGAESVGPVSGDEFRKKFDLPHDPKSVLEDILARDEFKEREKSLWSQFWESIREALFRVLKWIVDHLPRIGPLDIDEGVGEFILDLQLIGAVALLAGFVAWLWIRIIRNRRERFHLAAPTEAGVKSDLHGSGEARSMALKMAEKGNYRDGLIYLFRYVLMWLDENGKLTVGPGKTNREVLNSIPSDEPIRPVMAEMIPLFNGVRYGEAACDRADYERFHDLCSRVTDRT